MRKTVLFSSITLAAAGALALGCGNAATPISQSNSNAASPANDRPQSMIAHSADGAPSSGIAVSSAPASGERSKWSAGGEAIDTTQYDNDIKKAESEVKGKTSVADKQPLIDAYLKRALALTQSRQYAAALGDYRRVVKLDPDNPEAKQWTSTILNIYDGLKKEAPKEGEEPKPLPFVAGSSKDMSKQENKK